MILTVPVPDPRRGFLPLQITLGRATPTIPHLAKAIGPLYLCIVGLMVIMGKLLARVYPRVGSHYPGDPTCTYTRTRSLKM